VSLPLELYSLCTPNGQKVAVALEEMGLAYNSHRIDINKGDQFSDEFLAINPNGKIPAIIDPECSHNGEPLTIMESGAILIYLAEKTSMFLPTDKVARNCVIQWLMWQMGGVGPMFGQFGYFSVYAPRKSIVIEHAKERYKKEVLRLLGVLDRQLSRCEFVAGDDLSIADFAIMPWVVCLEYFYHAEQELQLETFTYVSAWVNKLKDRPAVQRGMVVCE